MENALSFGKSLIGTPYGWWGGGEIEHGHPMWAEDKPIPDRSDIISCSCVGLVNLILRYCNKQIPYNKTSKGGTDAYADYYKNVYEMVNIEKRYPIGTLLIRGYRDIDDQGHVAIIVEDKGTQSKLLQSFTFQEDNGVNMKYTFEESHDGYYYEYAVLPENWIL